MLVLAAEALPRQTQIALWTTGMTCVIQRARHVLIRSKHEQYPFDFRKADRYRAP
jgi:hypothetical protein